MGSTDYSKNPISHAVQMVKKLLLKNPFKKRFKLNKKIALPLLIVLGIFLLTIVYSLVVGLVIKKPAEAMVQNIKDSATSVQPKDLSGAESNLVLAQQNLDLVNKKFKLVSWVRLVPFFGGYI